MSDDALARKVDRLCADFGQPEHRNIGFVGQRLFALMKVGHRLADVESELRRRDAPIFLVGVPFRGQVARLIHPGDAVDAGQLRFHLWIGINGREEVDRLLAQESISASENLANLDATGLLTRRQELPADPTAAELLDWLVVGALTWAERGSTVRRYLDVLRTDEARRALDDFARRPDPDAPSRAMRAAVSDLVRRASQDGLRLAFQNCAPLVGDALQAFLGALTWAAAREVYQAREDELSGDLAQEILQQIARQSQLTAAQRAVIETHTRTLEVAWEHGIEEAIEQAEREFPVKLGTPSAEDYLQAYLEAPNLEAARDALRAAPGELFQIDDDTLAEGLRRADTGDDLWRIGLFEDARERGPDAAYHDWAELASIEADADDSKAIEQLTALVGRHRGCLRDRTLELLSDRYMRTGDLDARRAVLQELIDHRSACSPPSQRPFDLTILGLILGEQGEVAVARARIREALALIASIRDRAWRGRLWSRVGTFSRFYDDDLPMAVHSFRVAVEEFRAAEDLVSEAYVLEQLSAIYRWQHRVDLARVYAVLAQRATLAWDGRRGGMFDSGDVTYMVESGLAQTEFLLNGFSSAAHRLKGLLGLPRQIGDDERVRLERVALASAVGGGDLDYARQIIAAWSARSLDDWVAVGRAAMTVGDMLARDPSREVKPARMTELAGLGDALGRLGVSRPNVESFLDESALDRFTPALLGFLAGVSGGDPYVGRRLAGEYDDSARATRSERAAARLIPAPERGSDIALPPGASWPDVMARYHDLGVWELPDLAVLSGVLERWSLPSRFEGAIRINPPWPREGCLNFYFYRSDPERRLGGVPTCTYIPDGELIVCSLPYLDSMFRLDDAKWEADIRSWEAKAADSADEIHSTAAMAMARLMRGYERIIVEWIIAHEIGHAHLGHAAAASSAADALALEDAADSFFLDGILTDASVAVIMLAFFSLLNRLYEYDCQQQFHRTVIPRDLLDHPLLLDSTPDATGHRPLVFRAVSLVRSLLRMRPDLEDTTYIDKFAASLEPHREGAT